jgi:hypothetical protein
MRFDVRFDYSAPAFQRQFEDSLQRTGLGRTEALVIHDLEPRELGGLDNAREHLGVLRGGGFPALQALRAAGTIRAFGAGVNAAEDGEDVVLKDQWNVEYVDALLSMHEGTEGADRGIDFFLLANMYSLLNLSAHDLGILDKCQQSGVGVVVGGPYSSGILATGADPKCGGPAYYNYMPASEAVLVKTRRIEAVCERYNVPLIAAGALVEVGVVWVVLDGRGTRSRGSGCSWSWGHVVAMMGSRYAGLCGLWAFVCGVFSVVPTALGHVFYDMLCGLGCAALWFEAKDIYHSKHMTPCDPICLLRWVDIPRTSHRHRPHLPCTSLQRFSFPSAIRQ